MGEPTGVTTPARDGRQPGVLDRISRRRCSGSPRRRSRTPSDTPATIRPGRPRLSARGPPCSSRTTAGVRQPGWNTGGAEHGLGWPAWPNALVCSAEPWSWNPRPDGARCGRRSRPPSRPRTCPIAGHPVGLVVDDHPVTRAGIVATPGECRPGNPRGGRGGVGGRGVHRVACAPSRRGPSWTCRCSTATASMRSPGSGRRTARRASSRCRRSRVTSWSLGAFRAGARGYIGKEASGMDPGPGDPRGRLAARSWCREPRSSGSTRTSTARPTWSRSRIANARSAAARAGSTDREIAAALTISVKTVEKHVGSILRKLGAQNRTQAVALARERVAG